MERCEMPLLRYFVFVGGALAALLLLSNAVLPKPPVAEVTNTASELPMIRIHSAQKWPQRVVIDTSLPTIVPTQTATAEPVTPATTVADVPAQAGTRDAYAQLTTAVSKKPEPKPRRKHRVARRQMAPPIVVVAQQRPFNFFASNSW
jgi:hypothetical protein